MLPCMSDNPTAERLAQQMRYARGLDPEERANAERAAYYAKFDRAVGTLPPEQAAQVNLLSSYLDSKGTWQLRDSAAQLVAQVDEREEQASAPHEQEQIAKPREKNTDHKLLLLCAKKVNALDELLATVIPKAFDRIKKLEAQSAIDAKVIAELSSIPGRVEAIETRGFRFVGRYQAPATYKAGDVVAYKDSLWHCVADCKVGERPSTASHKWTLMLAGCEE